MKVLSYSNIGKKENNEDSFVILNNVFIVCDGVGGRNKGEVASKYVSTRFAELIQFTEFNGDNIKEVVEKIQLEIIELLQNHPEDKGMGTTLASVIIGDGKLYFTHIGDSRIYHFKDNEKTFYRTTDHSLVEDYLSAGLISKEEAKIHPKKNVITRAILADNSREFDEPTIYVVNDVKPNDFILICTDGVLESWDDAELSDLFFETNSTREDKFESIKKKCIAHTIDNNTAIVIQFEDSDFDSNGKLLSIAHDFDYETNVVPSIDVSYPEESNKKRFLMKNNALYIILSFIILLVLWKTCNKEKVKPMNKSRKSEAIYNNPISSSHFLNPKLTYEI